MATWFADDEELRAAKKGKTAAVVEEGFWDDEEAETDYDMEDVADMEAEEVADTDDEEGVTTPQATTQYVASEDDNLVTFERERLANIARRKAYMKELGLDKASGTIGIPPLCYLVLISYLLIYDWGRGGDCSAAFAANEAASSDDTTVTGGVGSSS